MDDDDDEDDGPDPVPLDGDEGLGAGLPRGNPPPADRFRELTMTTAGIVEVMKQVERARQKERKKDAQDKSLLKHLGKEQRNLFLRLSTHDLTAAPKLTEFMKELSETTSATKALQLVLSESRDWDGTFSHGGFHRFLSAGFVSQEQNRTNPGGFNLFMFHPRTVDLPGNKQFDSAKARMRDLFGAKVDDDTIAHYSKQGLFAASNHYDMKVQLQTALQMLTLLLGPGSLATKGLALVLEPPRWSMMTQTYCERFKAEETFGAKFIYCLDRSLQLFFRKVE